MTVPSKFPTEQILIATLFATLAYLLIFMFYKSINKKNAYHELGKPEKNNRSLIIWLLVVAFLVRIAFSYYLVGHKTDINCFTAWGDRIATGGFSGFYTSSFADYPPGYMYVLGIMSGFANMFGQSVRMTAEGITWLRNLIGDGIYTQPGAYNPIYVAIIKLPAIIADLAAAYLVFRLARKKLNFAPSFALMALVAFCPVIIYVSGGWGQIDQILALFLVAAILLLNSNRLILGGLVYGLAILLKPQALMAGPLLAVAYMLYIFDDGFFNKTEYTSKDSRAKRAGKTVAAVACACALIVIAAIPFSSPQMPWYQIIYEKYLGTATSYKFASVNAYNIYTLFGQNWASIDKTAILGLNYGQIGTIGMVLSVGFSIVLYWFGRKKHSGALTLSVAYMFTSLFTIGHYMHERYLFPVLLLLMVAYIAYSDRRLITLFMTYGVTLLVNCIAAFYYSKLHEYHLYWDERIVFWCSLANVLLYIAFTYICIDILIRGRIKKDVFQDDSDSEIPLMSANAEKIDEKNPDVENTTVKNEALASYEEV